jgi:hypothetical protein
MVAHPPDLVEVPSTHCGIASCLIPCVLAHWSLHSLPFPATLYATQKTPFTDYLEMDFGAFWFESASLKLL